MICPFRKSEYYGGFETNNCCEEECALWIENEGCAINSFAMSLGKIMQEVSRRE